MHRISIVVLIVIGVLISACSGGGASSSPARRSTITPRPLAAAASPTPTLPAPTATQSTAGLSTPDAQNQVMSYADMTATAECEEEGVVMAYVLFGTPTPTYTPIGALPSATPPAGDAASGQVLFHGEAACFSCHSTMPAEWLVGPSLSGISSRASTRVEGWSAQDYLRVIIRDPDRITPSAIPGIMPRTYSQTLSTRDIEDIVAYLMTLN